MFSKVNGIILIGIDFAEVHNMYQCEWHVDNCFEDVSLFDVIRYLSLLRENHTVSHFSCDRTDRELVPLSRALVRPSFFVNNSKFYVAVCKMIAIDCII